MMLNSHTETTRLLSFYIRQTEQSNSVLKHLGLHGDTELVLFRLHVACFRTEEHEQQWLFMDDSSRLEAVHEAELEDRDVVIFRPQEAAKTFLFDILTILMLIIGCPTGWSISFRGLDGRNVSWSQKDLLKDLETLSQFARRFKRDGRIELSFQSFDNAARPASASDILPWIRVEQSPGTANKKPGTANKKTSKSRHGLNGFGRYELLQKTCALSHFATRWDPAHLVPECLSGAHFTWIMATLQRCLEVADGPLPEDLTRTNAALEGLTKKISADKGVYKGSIRQTLDNNVFPLSPELHKALESNELWLNALEPLTVWLGEKRMPASLIMRQEMGPQDGLVDEIYCAKRKDRLLPSLFAASCKTLFARTVSRRLWNAFMYRAGQVVRYRNQQDAVSPDQCVDSQTSSKSKSATSESTFSDDEAEESQTRPRNHFLEWWVAQGASADEQETRQWVHAVSMVAVAALDRKRTEITSVGPRRRFRLVARACQAYLVPEGDGVDDTEGNLNFAECCKDIGADAQTLASALQDYCAAHSVREAEETFVMLSSDLASQVFFHAWPVLLSREAHLLPGPPLAASTKRKRPTSHSQRDVEETPATEDTPTEEETSTAPSSDVDAGESSDLDVGDAFWHAWPMLLTREDHLLPP